MKEEEFFSEEEAEEDIVIDWWCEWDWSGKDREVLIAWLKARPQDANKIVAYIIEHLENPNRRYLSGKSDKWQEYEFHQMCELFINGFIEYEDVDPSPKEIVQDKERKAEQTAKWQKLSYKQKIYEIHKQFSRYSEAYIGKIISDNLKKSQ